MNLKYLGKSSVFHFFSLKDSDAKIRLFDGGVSAGFPSPADDYMELDLDLHAHLVKNPSSTFCVKVMGESMKEARIHDGDVIIVDRSLDPKNRSIVLAVIDGEFTVKRINMHNNEIYLMPENDDFNPIKITSEMSFEIWGIVTFIIHESI